MHEKKRPMKENVYKGSAVIVEDDKLLALVQERILAKLGYQVVAKVKTAEDAIWEVKNQEPDFILMDISLKGDKDGIEAVQEIRKFSDVSVIYLSGTSDKYNYERAKKTGFIDYLIKPVTAGDLAGPLEEAATGKRSARHGRMSDNVNRAS